MSDIFALDDQGNRALAEAARMNAIDITQAQPTFFTGLGEGVGKGILRGGARVGQFIGMAGAAAIMPFLGPNASPEVLDPYFKAVDEYGNNAVDYWTPAQAEVGKAGQILGGLSEIALPLMAGAGNPTLLIGSQEIGTAADLARQGVDASTAVGAGVIQGTATAVGFKLPFLGKTLGTRMVSGAGGNLITNTAAAAATRELLESQGYRDQAAAFNPLDPVARFVDVLTGIAFGAIAHVTAPRMKPSEIAAVAAAANAKHFQSDTAPGIPADLNSAVAHQAAMEQAVRQLIEGEPVSTPDAVHNALFVHREQTLPPEVPKEFTDLDAQRAANAKYVAKQPDEAVPGYTVEEGVAHAGPGPRAESGPQIAESTAAGRPPAEGWRAATRIRGTRTTEPLTVYRGGENVVSAEHFADEAIGAKTGHPSSGLGVFFTTSKVQAEQWGKVRPAQLDIRNPKGIKVEKLPSFDSTAEARAYSADLAKQGFDGLIIKSKHLGGHDWVVAFKPEQVVTGGAAREKAAPRPPAGQAAATAGEAAHPVDPIVDAARIAASTSDLKVPTGEFSRDGAPVVESAADMFARSDAELAKAQNDAKGFDAAINCFLSKGAS